MNATARTIVVPENFATINDAVVSATPGDIILVREGVYYENPSINKSLTLMAEGNVTVIGEGGIERGAKAVFTITAENVVLLGFNIQSLRYSNSTFFATGINIAGDYVTIVDNTISGTYYGIFCSIQSSMNITQNTIIGAKKDGIRICGGSLNAISKNEIIGNAQSGIALNGYLDTIAENTVSDNVRGIGLGAALSIVFGNNFSNNSESGMYIAASNSIITSNTLSQNKWGVYFTSFFAAPNNNTFYSNNFVTNINSTGTDSIYNNQIWDNGQVGNYWSDYNGSDINYDGIGDSSYNVYPDNVDRYPLVDLSVLSSNTATPTLPNSPKTVNSFASLWHFDEIEPNGVTPDTLENNPVMLEPSGGGAFSPILTNGKFGNALCFNGTDYAYVLASPSLDIKEEITIDAWICVKEFKNIAYNNIFVECERTPDKYPTRILGFAFNGESSTNNSSQLQGALRGFVLDEDGVFNEIITTRTVIELDQWMHVVFILSAQEGMRIYVNDVEATVVVTSGLQNPTAKIARGTEFYIGHDSMSIIDEVSISTTAIKPALASNMPFWAEWWFLTAIGAVIVVVGIIYLLKSNSNKNSS